MLSIIVWLVDNYLDLVVPPLVFVERLGRWAQFLLLPVHATQFFVQFCRHCSAITLPWTQRYRTRTEECVNMGKCLVCCSEVRSTLLHLTTSWRLNSHQSSYADFRPSKTDTVCFHMLCIVDVIFLHLISYWVHDSSSQAAHKCPMLPHHNSLWKSLGHVRSLVSNVCCLHYGWPSNGVLESKTFTTSRRHDVGKGSVYAQRGWWKLWSSLSSLIWIAQIVTLEVLHPLRICQGLIDHKTEERQSQICQMAQFWASDTSTRLIPSPSWLGPSRTSGLDFEHPQCR